METEPESEVACSENSRHGDTGYDSFASASSGCSSIGFQENNQIDSNHIESDGEAKVSYSECFANKDVGHDGLIEIESETPKFEFKFRFPTYEEITRCKKGNGDSEILGQQNSVEKAVHEEVSETAEVPEKTEAKASAQLEKSENHLPGEENGAFERKFLSEKDFIASDSDSGSIISSSDMSQLVASTSDGFLSDKDFEGAKDWGNVELTEEDLDLEDMDSENLSIGYEPEDFDGEDNDILEQLRKIEESVQNSDNLKSEKFYGDVFHDKSNSKEEEFGAKDEKQMDGKPNSKNSSEWDTEDSNGLETLWEHQDLIEQLKMELKKVRATGLPTIFEESECPKIVEDLKPWKIEEKFQHGDRMGELHKFYKSYRERMRKFDILNYQKMYAAGFLESKDPLKSFSSGKSSSSPAITSVLSQSFRLSKHKKSELDPMKKFIRDLHSDLEVVYVGQLCLSWEILYWQYEKALELYESDPCGIRPYNEVAGEFQQFQVLLQRFIENEPFQGPRVENYVKNRCIMRNLLQVPVIRVANLKQHKLAGDKRKGRRGRDDGAITVDMLTEILEESIRIMWQFIRADKDASAVILKCRRDTQVELQDPADSVLLLEVRTDLQKKEKKLRDVLRSGSCVLKRFQKCQEDGIDHHFFFSQVDVKLVSRVLNMSRITTDQLVWCRSKLSQIRFVNRKMHVEPSFLLFPC
ncbi:hypothetical protein SLA2020_280420 [Shorea laevis]